MTTAITIWVIGCLFTLAYSYEAKMGILSQIVMAVMCLLCWPYALGLEIRTDIIKARRP